MGCVFTCHRGQRSQQTSRPQNKCVCVVVVVVSLPGLFQLVFHPCEAQKSKSAKASCCSAERLKGLQGGDRIGWSRVNSLSKLLTSMDSLIDGRNGGFTFLASRASQSMACQTQFHLTFCCFIFFILFNCYIGFSVSSSCFYVFSL